MLCKNFMEQPIKEMSLRRKPEMKWMNKFSLLRLENGMEKKF